MVPLNPFQAPTTAPGEAFDFPVVFFDDFVTGGKGTTVAGKFGSTADTAEWLCTLTNSATPVIGDDEPGGVLTITNAGADNDMVEMQLNGEMFKFATGKPLIFEARIKITDVSETDFLIGLGITDTTPLAGWTDYACFHCADSSGNLSFGNAKDGSGGAVGSETSGATVTDTGIDLVDDTFIVLRFETDGVSKIKAFVNGVLKVTHTTNICDNETLTPTICVRNDGAVAQTLEVDYVLVIQQR